MHGVEHGVGQSIGAQVLPNDHIGDHLGVVAPLEDATPVLRLGPEGGAVDQLAVVAQGKGAGGVVNHQGLNIADGGRAAAAALPHMADGRPGAVKGVQVGLVKDIGHQPFGLVSQQVSVQTYGDPAGILSPVLQGKKGLIGADRRIGQRLPCGDAEYAALLLEFLVGGSQRLPVFETVHSSFNSCCSLASFSAICPLISARAASSLAANSPSETARIWAASTAAFLAPFNATVATGMPEGI